MPEYIINNHEINFTRQAMNAAHQAYPREFAEWNLALKLKGKALLPGVTVREIAKPCTTWADTVQESASAGAPYPECTDAGRESEQCKPAPQPVDADKYEPVDVQPRKGDVMVHTKNGDRVLATGDGGMRGAGFEANRDRWGTPYSGTACVYTRKDGGGYRILKRKRPVAKVS